MAKLLLQSVIIMTVAIPIFAARDPNPKRGMKRAVLLVFVFNLFYLFAVRFFYPHLL
jgi:formate-dependent nitrite reductase membrane component NrfD